MKLGLVLEGGASRALFSCGVMDALLEANINADFVIGVSAGIAYGTSYVSRQTGRNLELSVKYLHDKRYMGVRHLLNPKKRSYYNMDFAFREIPWKLVPFDFEAFREYSKNSTVVAGLTNMDTGKIEYRELPTDDWDLHLRLLWASCSLPFLFQPEIIDGVPYMDGGICDPIPFRQALDSGCDKIITVLTRERNYSKHSEFSTRLASRTFKKHTEFSRALRERSEKYNNARRELFDLADSGKAIVIAPTDTTGFKRTERDPEKLQELYYDGYNTTKKMIPQIKEYLA